MDPATIAAAIQGGTALFNMFSGNQANKKMNKQMGQIQGYGREAYNPFIQQGQQAGQQLNPMYSQMAANPSGQYNDIMSQYQPSAGYQYKQGKLNQMMHNTAASGGYAGTGGDQQQRGELTNALMGEDMQQFLQNILGIKGAGMTGLQHQADTGYHAAGSMADYLGSAAGQKSLFNMVGQGQNQANRNEGASILAGLIGGKDKGQGALGDIFSKIFGGGGGATGGQGYNAGGVAGNVGGYGRDALFGGGGGQFQSLNSLFPGGS